MGFQPHIRTAIEQNYNLKIKSSKPGPRQRMAETYILDNDRGDRFFCKLIRKPLLIPQVERSLPVLQEMYDRGMTNTAPPVKGVSGFSTPVKEGIVVLFNYISAPQSETYSLYEFGRLMARIHEMTAEITTEIHREDFSGRDKINFEEYFGQAASACQADSAAAMLNEVLRRHERDIRAYVREFQRLCEVARAGDVDLVMTHGDAPGNVLVKSHDDLVLIDWDEIELAPAERDNWILDEFPEYMQGYRSVRPDYTINPDLRAFCILKYFFRSLNYYFEIIGDQNLPEKDRLQWVEDLETNLLTGWMTLKLKQVIDRASDVQITNSQTDFRIREFKPEDLERLQAICHEAFKPVFQSFREKLGEEIYAINHPGDDREQAEYLSRIAEPGSGADIFVAEVAGTIAGFVTVIFDKDKHVGTLDLNAVDPAFQGQSIGRKLYNHALSHMKQAGMRLAVVSTGGDDSHAPARRAYQKAGFDVVFPNVTMFKRL